MPTESRSRCSLMVVALASQRFKALGFGAGDGLDQAKNALRIPALEFLPPTRSVKR
ncbi:MAG: hypothetical protein HHJ17_14010 [Rhodoferax sp.]|uniref:hypothetical protein n=1 Tax=Rhodoferax sp. TaxID=50421 RepID=UPI0017AB4299|nr:hypothetical protein [Rhodoferax sp.]NMM14632.1 hypothetical protein [Rhodoferax sp.]